MIETYLRARGENPPKRLNLYGTFAAASLLEYGGLKPILPVLRGRSDAACRVVIRPSRLPPMGTTGLFITMRHAINATRPATSLQTPLRHRSRQLYCHGGHGVRAWWDGRGNLRVAKTPPLQSALRGGRCWVSPLASIYDHAGCHCARIAHYLFVPRRSAGDY